MLRAAPVIVPAHHIARGEGLCSNVPLSLQDARSSHRGEMASITSQKTGMPMRMFVLVFALSLRPILLRHVWVVS